MLACIWTTGRHTITGSQCKNKSFVFSDVARFWWSWWITTAQPYSIKEGPITHILAQQIACPWQRWPCNKALIHHISSREFLTVTYYQLYQIQMFPLGIPACHNLPPPYQSSTTPFSPSTDLSLKAVSISNKTHSFLSLHGSTRIWTASPKFQGATVSMLLQITINTELLWAIKKGTVPLNIWYGPTLSNMVSTPTCSYLKYLKLNKMNKISSSVAINTYQIHSSHKWLVATILERADIQYFHHRRNFCWTGPGHTINASEE